MWNLVKQFLPILLKLFFGNIFKPTPVPNPDPKDPVKPPTPQPDPVKPPAHITYDSGVLAVTVNTSFVCILQADPAIAGTAIKHKGGNVVLVNVKRGDNFLVNTYHLQQIGVTDLDITLNTAGDRTLHVKRDGTVIASMPLLVKPKE